MLGNPVDAISLLDSIRSKREVDLACSIALLFFHQKSQRLDRDEIDALRTLIPTIEDTASDSARLLAAHFSLLSGDYDRSRRYTSKLCNLQSGAGYGDLNASQALALTLRALSRVRESAGNAVGGNGQLLQEVEHLKRVRDLDASMALAEIASVSLGSDMALSELNHVIAKAPNFYPALVEKAKLMIGFGDWDQSADSVSRVLELDPENLHGLKLDALYRCIHHTTQEDTLVAVRKVASILNGKEVGNVDALLETSKLFASFASDVQSILNTTTEMLNAALAAQPQNSAIFTELAHQKYLQCDFRHALDSYRTASQLEESNFAALLGAIRCQIRLGELDDAEQQLEFLQAVLETETSCAELSLIEAMIVWERSGEAERHCCLLVKAMESKKDALSRTHFTDVFHRLTANDPQFLVAIADQYLLHSRQAPGCTGGSHLPDAVKLGIEVMREVLSLAPGHIAVHLKIAEALRENGQCADAKRAIDRCIGLAPNHSRAHIVGAKIALASKNYTGARHHVEEALSCDFSIRSSIEFSLIQARILRRQGAMDDALSILQAAIEPGTGAPGEARFSTSLQVEADTVAAYNELALLLAMLTRHAEAKAVIGQAKEMFKGSRHEVDVIIAESRVAIERNDVEMAIRLLSRVSRRSTGFQQAQLEKAELLLKYRHDKRAFAQVHEDLVHTAPSTAAYMNLGDAYMKIQNPERAVVAYEKALELKPQDVSLANRVGQALICTHDYNKAVAYYSKALMTMPGSSELRAELVKLLTKLRRHEQAIQVLQESPTGNSQDDRIDLSTRIHRVVELRLLADIYASCTQTEDLRETLLRAINEQRHVVELCRPTTDGAETVVEQRKILTSLHLQFGKLAEAEKDEDKAKDHYSEALRHTATHEESMIALARLYLRARDWENCRKQCETLLRVNAAHEDANMVLAELSFSEGNFSDATKRYEEQMKARPDNYVALSHLIGLLRRAGKMHEIRSYLERAEQANARAFSHAGLNYCKGLFYRHSNDAYEAIRYFNYARRDGTWGVVSIYNMIELYLNPENENMWHFSEEMLERQKEPVQIAERLLGELRNYFSAEHPVRYRILEAYVAMEKYQVGSAKESSNQKQLLEQAEHSLIEIVEEDRDNVPAMLGLCTLFMIERAENKARNMLKRIAKMPYNHDLAEEFERSYLHLAEIYIERSKYDLASDLCHKALDCNKSCGKAWEFLGIISEKELSYKDAADSYEKAWKCLNESSPPVGFRLAFNYMKARRFVEAIEICSKVVRRFPDYPKIKEEILDKCMKELKP